MHIVIASDCSYLLSFNKLGFNKQSNNKDVQRNLREFMAFNYLANRASALRAEFDC
ncbi:MAG: hypothetical protein ACI9SP_001440 [Arenicella sp.]|jgi:hypothetical protein